jgi:hypothetical protein
MTFVKSCDIFSRGTTPWCGAVSNSQFLWINTTNLRWDGTYPKNIKILPFNWQFLEGLIERQPDMLLVELQDHLREACNVVASISTIARTVYGRGFTMKRVNTMFFMCDSMLYHSKHFRLPGLLLSAMRTIVLVTKCLWHVLSMA